MTTKEEFMELREWEESSELDEQRIEEISLLLSAVHRTQEEAPELAQLKYNDSGELPPQPPMEEYSEAA